MQDTVKQRGYRPLPFLYIPFTKVSINILVPKHWSTKSSSYPSFLYVLVLST